MSDEADWPQCIIVAGPNGAGKTTSVRALATGRHGVARIVNPDTIAAGLSGAPELGSLAAGKLALQTQAGYIADRADFAMETTLAGRRWQAFLDALHDARYHVTLYFLWVPDPSLCVARVRSRVMQGGHGVPESDIRRRWVSGFVNLERVFLLRVHAWSVLNAGDATGLQRIAHGGHGRQTFIADPVAWARMRQATTSGFKSGESPPRVGEAPVTYAGAPGQDGTAPDAIELANRALRRAMAVHRALGVPWAVWGANGVEWIAPEDLPELPVDERGCLPESSSPPARQASRGARRDSGV